MQYILEQFGVAVAAITGVLAARGKHLDLFGVLVLALVTAFGGGTIRDLCLARGPVFWVTDSNYLFNATIIGVLAFFLVRLRPIPAMGLLVADAFSLALFTIVGVQKAMAAEASIPISVAMGVVTGVVGGVLRDTLTGEIPLVFRPEIYLYATASFVGALTFVWLADAHPHDLTATIVGTSTTLGLRLAAIRWKVTLPEFKDEPPWSI
jgi:uncharacterized membrane protein YeiH